MTSHTDALAAIKARHAALAAKFADPAVTVIEDGITDYGMVHQVGLLSVYVDPIGRFWTVTLDGERRRLTARMVLDPRGPTRGREDFDLQNHMGLQFPHADQPRG